MPDWLNPIEITERLWPMMWAKPLLILEIITLCVIVFGGVLLTVNNSIKSVNPEGTIPGFDRVVKWRRLGLLVLILVGFVIVNGSLLSFLSAIEQPPSTTPNTNITLQAVNIDHGTYVKCIADDSTLTPSLGKAYFTVVPSWDGYILTNAYAFVYGASSSGKPTINIYNVTRKAYMLSTPITIDPKQLNSLNATTPPVIDQNNALLTAGDILRIDVLSAGTSTKGLDVTLDYKIKR